MGASRLERLNSTIAARESLEVWIKNLSEMFAATGSIHARGERGTYRFKKEFPRGIVGAREKPFWYAADASELPPARPFTSREGKILAMHTLLNGEIGTVGAHGKNHYRVSRSSLGHALRIGAPSLG